jgi:GNAT superfamily N-acetyltransferase
VTSVVRQVERRAIAAWPAEVVQENAGWLLRHTPAVRRRRSNSAVPPPRRGSEAAIEDIEAFYRRRGRPVLIQVGPDENHRDLDTLLAGRGYRREAPTAVMTAFTADVVAATEPSPADLAESPDAWVKTFAELDEHADSAMVGEKVISRIAAPVAFVSVTRDGRAAGMGLFAADSGWAGVFSMATRPDRRGQGIATAVLGTGARWAARNGAHRLYLQVETDNHPARALYGRAGFTWSHGYHYRVAP